MKAEDIISGQEFEVEYPFVRDTFTEWDEDGSHDVPCWRPGTRDEFVAPDDCEAVADGIGAQFLHVVSTHKPGQRWPERVFYTRKWRDPDGKVFGKNKLHIVTKGAFNRRCRGFFYRYRLPETNADGSTHFWPQRIHRGWI